MLTLLEYCFFSDIVRIYYIRLADESGSMNRNHLNNVESKNVDGKMSKAIRSKIKMSKAIRPKIKMSKRENIEQ